jgi:hypothetical protein
MSGEPGRDDETRSLSTLLITATASGVTSIRPGQCCSIFTDTKLAKAAVIQFCTPQLIVRSGVGSRTPAFSKGDSASNAERFGVRASAMKRSSSRWRTAFHPTLSAGRNWRETQSIGRQRHDIAVQLRRRSAEAPQKRRDQAPPASSTASQSMRPGSVTTPETRPPRFSIPHTAQLVRMVVPSRRAAAIATLAFCGSARPSVGLYVPPHIGWSSPAGAPQPHPRSGGGNRVGRVRTAAAIPPDTDHPPGNGWYRGRLPSGIRSLRPRLHSSPTFADSRR